METFPGFATLTPAQQETLRASEPRKQQRDAELEGLMANRPNWKGVELKDAGQTIVLVEQYLTYALRFADICYVLAKGSVAFVGEPDELRDSEALASSYLGVG